MHSERSSGRRNRGSGSPFPPFPLHVPPSRDGICTGFLHYGTEKKLPQPASSLQSENNDPVSSLGYENSRDSLEEGRIRMIYSFGEFLSSPLCSLEARRAREEGVLFYGSRKGFCRLSELLPGARAFLVRIEGDQKLQERMTLGGIFPGNLLTLLPCPSRFMRKKIYRICCDYLETILFPEEALHLIVCPLPTKRADCSKSEFQKDGNHRPQDLSKTKEAPSPL